MEIPWATVLVALLSLLLLYGPLILLTYEQKRGIKTRWSRICAWLWNHSFEVIGVGVFATGWAWELEHGMLVSDLAYEWVLPVFVGGSIGWALRVLLTRLWALHKARKQRS